jgi:hypothetical protein
LGAAVEFVAEGCQGDFAQRGGGVQSLGGGAAPEDDRCAVFQLLDVEFLVAVDQVRDAGQLLAVAGLPFAFLGDLDEDPVVLTASEKRVAVLALGGLVHVDLRAAVGAVAFNEAGPGGLGFCAAAAEEGPDFGEGLADGGEDAAVAEADLLIEGAGGDANGELVEMGVGDGVGEGNGFDRDVVHPVAVAEGLLLVELEGKAFVDGVGDEGADWGEVLVAPSLLDFVEGDVHALDKAGLVEGRVAGVQRAEDLLAIGEVVAGVGFADDVGLPGAFAFASGEPEEGDGQGENREADIGVVVAEAK